MNFLSNISDYLRRTARLATSVGAAGKGEADHLVLGKNGEKVALKFLRNKGYRHLKSNYISNRQEIDLIMQDGKVLVFVEVKTRRNEDFAPGESAVNRQKQKHISFAARQFIRKYDLQDLLSSFDVIVVIMHNGIKPEIRHHENAFRDR